VTACMHNQDSLATWPAVFIDTACRTFESIFSLL